jgi:hypothetical protein
MTLFFSRVLQTQSNSPSFFSLTHSLTLYLAVSFAVSIFNDMQLFIEIKKDRKKKLKRKFIIIHIFSALLYVLRHNSNFIGFHESTMSLVLRLCLASWLYRKKIYFRKINLRSSSFFCCMFGIERRNESRKIMLKEPVQLILLFDIKVAERFQSTIQQKKSSFKELVF